MNYDDGEYLRMAKFELPIKQVNMKMCCTYLCNE